jgi:hypothetical protein
MTRETTGNGLTYDGTHFWSGRVQLEKSKVAVGDTAEYKFIIGYDWGRDEGFNRTLVIPTGKKDTTIYWDWYNHEAPVVRDNPDSIVVTFRADMTTAKNKQSFSDGDSVIVEVGHFATADSIRRSVPLLKQGLTNYYQASVTMFSKVGEPLDYQYYLIKNAADNREYYYNFDYSGGITAEAERRQVTVSGTTMTVRDTVVSVTDSRRQPHFAGQRNLTQAVAVKWVVDVRPAYYQVLAGSTLDDIQGNLDVTSKDSITAWGVGMNGPATGGWATWNSTMVADTNSLHKMWDDGTHGDVQAGDSLYTITLNYTTANIIGQVYKFGIGGGDNESAFGLNHLDNIDDTSPTFTVQAQWGSINPNFYNAWDYDLMQPKTPVSVEGVAGTIPDAFGLAQNYPNPFNPTTTFAYSIPIQADVTLKIFNLLGQEMATLAQGRRNAGTYQILFDASELTSGIYFYRIEAGSFVSTKKMILVK